MYCAVAARLTDRWRDQAAKPRQARMHMPRKPRAAPTAMKTVPSGTVDFCINGALAVFGMMAVGIPTPAIVGTPLRPPAKLPVGLGEPPVKSEVLDPVLAVDGFPVVASFPELLLVEADEDASFDVELLADGEGVFPVVEPPAGWVMVLRFGRFERLIEAETRLIKVNKRSTEKTER